MNTFAIHITTKNRREALQFTLEQLSSIIQCAEVVCTVCDDASNDGTAAMVKKEFPSVNLIENRRVKGYLHNRNRMLRETSADYAISLDDDAHLVSTDVLETIQDHFTNHPACAIIAARIFWGCHLPESNNSNQNSERVKGFVGCGHIWNMTAWREIPDYPEWFEFYGEEEFAAYQLFKKGWEVHYVPQVFIQHRVVVKNRKMDRDYGLRLRRSLRSGWYNYVLFMPSSKIPKRFIYTLWIQLRLKVFKGDFKAGIAIFKAVFDVFLQFPRLLMKRNALDADEFKRYEKLADTKIYWKP